MNKEKLYEAVELAEKHQLFRLDKNFNERLAALIAEVRAAQPPQDERRRISDGEQNIRAALSDLLEYCGEQNPCQGFDETDDPRVIAAGRALATSAPAQQATPPQPVAAEVVELDREDGWLPVKDGVWDDWFIPVGDEHARRDLTTGWVWTRATRVIYLAGTGSDESAKENGNG